MACTPLDRRAAVTLDGDLSRMFRALQDRPLSEMLRWTVEQLEAPAETREREACAA